MATLTNRYAHFHRYSPSGKYSAPGLVAGLVVGSLASVVLAFAYAYGIFSITSPRARFLLPLFFGVAIGAAAGQVMCWAKVRNGAVAAWVGLATSVVGLYVSWAIWIEYIQGDSPWIFNPLPAIVHPGALWHAILTVNAEGAWSYEHGQPVHGIWLWIIWFLEAATVLGFGAAFATVMIERLPFCEQCNLWCSERAKVCIAPVVTADQLLKQLEAEDLSALAKLPPGNKKKKPFFRLDLNSCGNCHNVNTLTVVQVSRKNSTAILNKVILSPEQASVIRSLALNRV
jgi:hypothetical protein